MTIMRDSNPDVNGCAQLGHGYLSLVVIWCPHQNAHRASLSQWVDINDDTEVHDHINYSFGPFDTLDEISDEIERMVRDGVGSLGGGWQATDRHF